MVLPRFGTFENDRTLGDGYHEALLALLDQEHPLLHGGTAPPPTRAVAAPAPMTAVAAAIPARTVAPPLADASPEELLLQRWAQHRCRASAALLRCNLRPMVLGHIEPRFDDGSATERAERALDHVLSRATGFDGAVPFSTWLCRLVRQACT